jgi:opacity protein-like surface antigen
MRGRLQVIASLLFVLGFVRSASSEDWSNTLTPYLWFTAVQGTMVMGTPLGPIGGGVDLGADQVLKNLKIAGMLDYRGQNERWAVLADVLYADLSASGSKTQGPFTLHVTAGEKITILETDVGYRITPMFLAFVGARYYGVSVSLDATSDGPIQSRTGSASRSVDWVDPVIGLSAEVPFAEHWSLRLRGDMGGFGVGAQFSWQGVAAVTWQVTKTIEVVGGYKYLREEYENGAGSNYFKYDIAMSGPALGVAFTF